MQDAAKHRLMGAAPAAGTRRPHTSELKVFRSRKKNENNMCAEIQKDATDVGSPDDDSVEDYSKEALELIKGLSHTRDVCVLAP